MSILSEIIVYLKILEVLVPTENIVYPKVLKVSTLNEIIVHLKVLEVLVPIENIVHMKVFE